MLRHLFQLSVACALVLAVGGHWMVLQSVAWVGMAVNYSKTDPLPVALKKTFDGQHPCRMCIAVKEGKQNEQQRTLLQVETKLDFLCLSLMLPMHPHFAETFLSVPSEHADGRVESPPIPPPRFA